MMGVKKTLPMPKSYKPRANTQCPRFTNPMSVPAKHCRHSLQSASAVPVHDITTHQDRSGSRQQEHRNSKHTEAAASHKKGSRVPTRWLLQVWYAAVSYLGAVWSTPAQTVASPRISCRILAMALPGFRPLGHTLAQFMIW
jgi:hypothetical protein